MPFTQWQIFGDFNLLTKETHATQTMYSELYVWSVGIQLTSFFFSNYVGLTHGRHSVTFSRFTGWS